MVLLVNNSPLSDTPRSLNWLYNQYPSLKDGAKQLAGTEPKQIHSSGSLFVSAREYAVTHSQDSKLSVVGTDNLINNTAIIIRNSGSLIFIKKIEKIKFFMFMSKTSNYNTF